MKNSFRVGLTTGHEETVEVLGYDFDENWLVFTSDDELIRFNINHVTFFTSRPSMTQELGSSGGGSY